MQILVNVVNYKLHKMGKKIESSCSSTASFHCLNNNCKKEFTDFEANTLVDPENPDKDFRCPSCQTGIEKGPFPLENGSQSKLARFDEQMAPLYKLLREVENLKLAPSLLVPEHPDFRRYTF